MIHWGFHIGDTRLGGIRIFDARIKSQHDAQWRASNYQSRRITDFLTPRHQCENPYCPRSGGRVQTKTQTPKLWSVSQTQEPGSLGLCVSCNFTLPDVQPAKSLYFPMGIFLHTNHTCVCQTRPHHYSRPAAQHQPQAQGSPCSTTTTHRPSIHQTLVFLICNS